MRFDISLTTVDYTVAGVTLVVPLVIGVYFAVKDAHTSTREEYLMGGREMPTVPVMLSLFITFQSSISQVGLPAESYYHGGIYLLAGFGLGLSYVIGALTTVPLLYPLRLTSVYEYLSLRYRSEIVRMLSTLLGMLITICFTALALLTSALALRTCANVPLWMSIVLLGAVATLYTSVGGFKCVVWSGVFHTVVVAAGTAAVLTKGILEVGGPGAVWKFAHQGGRLDFNKFSPDLTVRHSFWGVTVAHCFIGLVHGFSQPAVQRISSVESLHGAKNAFLTLTGIVAVSSAVFSLLGLVIFAFFSLRLCDPLEASFISTRNQLVPYFVSHVLTDPQGIKGLYVAVLCCGSLSTLSSGLNALAANTVVDLLKRPLQKLSEEKMTSIAKLVVAAYGTLIIGLAYLAQWYQGSILQMSLTIFGVLGSPIVGVFILGASVPWTNKFGALTGAVTSLVFNIWIWVGSELYESPSPKDLRSVGTAGCSVFAKLANVTEINQQNISSFFIELTNSTNAILDTDENGNLDLFSSHDNANRSSRGKPEPLQVSEFFLLLYRTSYEWYSLFGILVCVFVGLVVSYIAHCLVLYRRDASPSERANQARYIFPFLRKFWDMEYREFLTYSAAYVETPLVRVARGIHKHPVLHAKEQRRLANT